MQLAAEKAARNVGAVAVAPVLDIVTPEPCVIVVVPLAPIFITLIIDPTGNATELSGGIVIVVALVLL
jgi:hypothetical protein